MREKETQELLKMGTAGADKKKTKLFGKVRYALNALQAVNALELSPAYLIEMELSPAYL